MRKRFFQNTSRVAPPLSTASQPKIRSVPVVFNCLEKPTPHIMQQRIPFPTRRLAPCPNRQKKATRSDPYGVPENMIDEIIGGELILTPAPKKRMVMQQIHLLIDNHQHTSIAIPSFSVRNMSKLFSKYFFATFITLSLQFLFISI